MTRILDVPMASGVPNPSPCPGRDLGRVTLTPPRSLSGALHLGAALALAVFTLPWAPAPGFAQDRTAELDAFWAELSRTVAEGDFEGYAATYHDDAILVSGIAETSYPIAQALDGWKQGFLDTKAGTMEASVEFRFTERLGDETTAHETGIFHYQTVDEEGNRSGQFIHFEALLIKKGGWTMMMEYQRSLATQEEWDAAGSGG